jgi:hypothetical protein
LTPQRSEISLLFNQMGSNSGEKSPRKCPALRALPDLKVR